MASRVAKNPITIPADVDVNIQGQMLTVKNNKATVQHNLHPAVQLNKSDGVLHIALINDKGADAIAGTTRALVNNLITGLSKGFERKLVLVGVGYRAQVQGKKLNLVLGHSHPVAYEIPPEITVETPSQTEIVLKSFDKEVLGRAAAKIRSFRPPEPYKGKGVRYADEVIVLKEVKKK